MSEALRQRAPVACDPSGCDGLAIDDVYHLVVYHVARAVDNGGREKESEGPFATRAAPWQRCSCDGGEER